MEIVIGKGVGKFIFGQSKHDIERQLGKPDKAIVDDYDCIYLIYNSIETTFKIEKENNNKFSWFETSSQESTIFDISPWAIDKKDLIPQVVAILNESPEIDDYGSFESFTFMDACLELQFEYGKLKNINIGVLYNEEDIAIWPNGLESSQTIKKQIRH